jgi:hypothetical protein
MVVGYGQSLLQVDRFNRHRYQTSRFAMTFSALRLRFFHLSRQKRLDIFVALGALPADLDVFPTMGVELLALRRIQREEKIDELEKAMGLT